MHLARYCPEIGVSPLATFVTPYIYRFTVKAQIFYYLGSNEKINDFGKDAIREVLPIFKNVILKAFYPLILILSICISSAYLFNHSLWLCSLLEFLIWNDFRVLFSSLTLRNLHSFQLFNSMRCAWLSFYK